ALEDVRGRQGVDLLGTFGTANVRRNHCSFNRLRRPPLIPQKDWELERSEVAGEGSHRLGAGAVRTVHVQRQTNNQANDVLTPREVLKRLQVMCELRPADGLSGSCEVPSGIA